MGTHRSLGGDISRRRFLKLGGAGLAGAAFGGGMLSSCGGASSPEDFPERPIEVVVAYEAGGGTDVGARILQPFVEEELGVNLEIVNMPGGGGWAGWTQIANANPDGYTVGFINSPNFMTGYLDPRQGREDVGLSSFQPLGNQVTDYGAIAINPNDDRFGDIEELMEHAQDNELTVTSTGVGSDDHFASLALGDQHGAQFRVIHNDGAADSTAALLGQNVDVVFANVGELYTLHNDGEINIVAVMREGDERSEFLPDVPTLGEAGYPDVYSWSSRGLAGPAGIDQQIMDKLVQAFERGIQNQAHIDELASQGLQVDYRATQEHREMLQQDQDRAERLGQEYIWGESSA